MENETQTPEEVKPLSIVEEAARIRDEIVKQKEELKAEREKMEKLQATELLGGTTGSHIKPQPPKEETPEEYAKRIISKPYGDVKVDTPE